MTAQQVIDFFKMKPLPREGGYYVEAYRSDDKIAAEALGQRYRGHRNFSSAILYLLTADTFSALHRLRSDEVFHFYLGDAVTMLQLHPGGTSEVVILGQDIFAGQRLQVTVPHDTWQGCMLNKGGKFALMGTTVAPGFDYDDFELGGREQLQRQYPNQHELIGKLTAEDRC